MIPAREELEFIAQCNGTTVEEILKRIKNAEMQVQTGEIHFRPEKAFEIREDED